MVAKVDLGIETGQRVKTLRLRVLTLNAWGVPTARDRRERMRAIGQTIGRLGVDVAALQEVWLESDRHLIVSEANQFAPYHDHYFSASRSFGSGMLVLSRFPFADLEFMAFPASGSPEKFRQGDYYGGKGIGLARLSTPLGPLDIYNLHTVARYQDYGQDAYRSQRVAQVYAALRFLARRSGSRPALLVGDFNTRPESFGYQLVNLLGGLRDLYRALQPRLAGHTYSSNNPYTSGQESERIDYIFYRGGQQSDLKPLAVELLQNGTAPLLPALSDHNGLLAEIELARTLAPAWNLPKISLPQLARLSGELERGEDYVRQQRNRLFVKLGGGLLSTLLARRLCSLPGTARRLLEAGAIGVTLFNLYHLSYLLRTELNEYEQILKEVDSLRHLAH